MVASVTECIVGSSAPSLAKVESAIDIPRLLAGDGGAWDAFVTWSAPYIRAAVLRTLASRGAARDGDRIEDVVQNVYLRLVQDQFRLLRRYDPHQASMRTWLALIARSTTLNSNSRTEFVSVPLEDVAESLLAPSSREVEPVAIPPGVLSEREEKVIELHYRDGRSLEEVAGLLSLSRKTVYNCKSNAVGKLRRHFGKF